MALRSLTTRMRGPAAAAYALRRHQAPGVPPPPPAALPRFLVTTCRRQAKPHSKGIQQEALSVAEMVYLMVEMHKLVKAKKQRMVELEELQCLKKRVLKIFAFSFAGISSLILYQANKNTAMVAQVTSP